MSSACVRAIVEELAGNQKTDEEKKFIEAAGEAAKDKKTTAEAVDQLKRVNEILKERLENSK